MLETPENSQVQKRGRGRPRLPDHLLAKRRRSKLVRPDIAADLKALVIERLIRRVDGLSLYKPMPFQKEFHDSEARERLIRGSNRSGKTTAAAAEVARAVTGQSDRYPKENGIAYLVGKDSKEVANVMYKLLFRAGAIKMVRDEVTKNWRSYNPSDPKDFARIKEAKYAPPFIPRRMIASVSWEKKASNIPTMITLKNGWEIHFFSSNAKPPHGTQIDLAWFDEEIVDSDWYPEISARRVDRNGRFIWSATPQAGTAQLYELHERADEQLKLPKEKRSLEEFVALISENEHLTYEQKKDFERTLSQEDIMVRIHGEFASHGMRVFPEFSEKTHICPYFSIPNDWTKYVAIDPGRQVCGVLFAAIPPDDADNADCLYVFDELYMHQCSAEIFGQNMRMKCRGFEAEAFIIDHQMSRMTEMGSGRTIEDQYAEALDRNCVACHRTGCQFTWGVADPQGGIEAVREYITLRGEKGPRLKVLADRCPNFIWEMKRYWYERDKDGRVTDKPRDRGPVHLCACIRYIIQDKPVFVRDRVRKPKPGPIWLHAQKLMNPDGKKGVINLGPGSFQIGVRSS